MNWIPFRERNGSMEGLNSLIQAAKAKAKGYRTLKDLKSNAYPVTLKLNFANIHTAKLACRSPSQIVRKPECRCPILDF